MNIFRRRHYIEQINLALEIRLTRWQKRYIFTSCAYVPSVRGSGRTLAHMLRLCVSEGDRLFITHVIAAQDDLTDYYEFGLDKLNVNYVEYSKFYLRELQRVYSLLKEKTDLQLRQLHIVV